MQVVFMTTCIAVNDNKVGIMTTLNFHWKRQGHAINHVYLYKKYLCWNKANLRDLIAATGLVILLKFDPIHRFFSLCDLEIWCMTLKNNRAPLLYYIRLCVSFQIHRWIQTEVTVRKRSIRVKIGDFLSCVTLKFDGWPWKKNRAPLLYYIKLCISFHTHWWFQISVTVRKRSIRVKIYDFLSCVT